MVKAVTTRAVVVRCPDSGCFEQAIFMLRENAPEGMDLEQAVQQATAVANRYVRQAKSPRRWYYMAGGLGVLGLLALGCLVLAL